MLYLPKAAEPLVSAFSVAFTRPTFQRVMVLILGAILCVRQRTVTAMLRAVGPLATGHWSDFHRVLCCRVWSTWPLGKVLAAMVLELIPEDQPLVCPADDTTPQHKSKRVYGKGCHRDACRSTHSHMVWVWGDKWAVLAINVKLAFASPALELNCHHRNKCARRSASSFLAVCSPLSLQIPRLVNGGRALGAPSPKVASDELAQRAGAYCGACERAGKSAWLSIRPDLLQTHEDVEISVILALAQIIERSSDAGELLGTLHLGLECFQRLPVVSVHHGVYPRSYRACCSSAHAIILTLSAGQQPDRARR